MPEIYSASRWSAWSWKAQKSLSARHDSIQSICMVHATWHVPRLWVISHGNRSVEQLVCSAHQKCIRVHEKYAQTMQGAWASCRFALQKQVCEEIPNVWIEKSGYSDRGDCDTHASHTSAKLRQFEESRKKVTFAIHLRRQYFLRVLEVNPSVSSMKPLSVGVHRCRPISSLMMVVRTTCCCC